MCHSRRLWNGMFDRHRAEITVMQFTGHSLPVHHFVTAPWHFYLIPYCQPSPPTRFLPITGHRNVTPAVFGMACLIVIEQNNRHAVHRSLSSGASLCDGTVAFLPYPILSAKPAYAISGHRNVSLPPSLEWHVDRHRAEITVMQLTGHYIPVHHFVAARWDFFTLSHIVSQAVFYSIY